ncbi:MAG: YggT family protein [bacterium]
MPYVQDALSVTIEVLVGLYLIAVILRFLFQLFRVDFRNPISQTIVKITNPPLRLLRKFIPGLFGIDMASVVLILIVGCLKLFLLTSIAGLRISPAAILVLSVAEILNIVCWTLLIAIFARAIISWVAPRSYHPAIRILDGLSEPLLSPFRRLLPNTGGLDLSPIFAILAINLVQRLLINPLFDFSRQLL